MSKLITTGLGPVVKTGDPGQLPGREDTLVTERTIGGPLSGKDVRLYLDKATLEHLLNVARSSTVGRVQMNGIGVRIRLWRTKCGHTYETWQLLSHDPAPETSGFSL